LYGAVTGAESSIEIRQDASTGFSRILFLEASEEKAARAESLLKKTWPKIKLIREDGKYRVDIPAEYRHPHEEHFNMVGQEFIGCIRKGSIPEWEKENTLTKYHITTEAVETAVNDL